MEETFNIFLMFSDYYGYEVICINLNQHSKQEKKAFSEFKVTVKAIK